MKKLSLDFFSQILELNYQKQNTNSHLEVFGRSLIAFEIIVICTSIYAFMLRQFWTAYLLIAYFLFALIIYYTLKKHRKLFDFFCFSFQISLALAYPMLCLCNLITGIFSDANSCLYGQAIAFMIQSVNLSSRFYLKFILILTNIIAELFISIVIIKNVTFITIFWLVSNILVVINMYWHDRIIREAFLIKNNQKIWLNEVGKCAQMSIISCALEKGELRLDVEECNEISKREFKIHDQDSFKSFLYSTILVPKKYFRQKTQLNMKFKNEQKEYSNLYKQIIIISQSDYNECTQFIGLYNNNLYNFKIFTTWNNDLMNIHILITKPIIKDFEKKNSIQYENKLFNNFRLKVDSQLKTVLIQLKSIYKMKNPKLCNYSIMSVAYDALRSNYNLQLYLNPIYKINRSSFLLEPLIKNIQSIVRQRVPDLLDLNISWVTDTGLLLYSCQKTIFHIIFNLLSMIVEQTQDPGYIRIQVEQTSTQIGSFINFFITTNIASFDLFLKGQNYPSYKQNLNSQYQMKDIFSIVRNKKGQIGLEMIVSEYLIGKIGPYRSIKLIDGSLSFTIFQNLKVLAE